MYRYIKNTKEVSYDQIISDQIPCMLDITVFIDDYNSVIESADNNTYVGVAKEILDSIFKDTESIRNFANEIRSVLNTKYNLTTTVPDINMNNTSVYIGCMKQIGSTMFELDLEIGYILRVSDHGQKVPYSKDTKEARNSTIQRIINYVKNILRLTKSSETVSTEFPDIDMSIVLKLPEDKLIEKDFGNNLQGLVEYIALKMNEYIENLINDSI